MTPELPNLETVTTRLVETYTACSRMNHLGHDPLPNRDAVASILEALVEVLYPGYGRRQNLHLGNIAYFVGTMLDDIHGQLTEQIARALLHDASDCAEAAIRASAFLNRLPEIRMTLERDVEAAYRGDPAAKSHHEIIFCYPGLDAISTYRLAHELHQLKVPYIPRMMTELAHTRTGIDIHPGATIGEGFFIDHGTGVVIGETCHIGKGVKLYQGVTLGALSFDRDESGELTHGAYKRHPTLEDGVVVYANATILGGRTIIGHGAVIGSNVWITESVPPDTTVVLEKPKLRVKGARPAHGETDVMYHI